MADLASVLESVFRDLVPAIGRTGIEVVEAEPCHARLRLPHRAENVNHVGTAYAGTLFAFLEASGGALILCSLDISRWVPVIVEATIRYQRAVTGAIECDLRLTETERDELVAGLEADPKMRWTLAARAVDEAGEVACEADLAYRFKRAG